MSFEFYKIMHLLGIYMLFFGFGGVLLLAYSGHGFSGRKKLLAFISHGLGLLLMLISGFGMAARLGYMGALPTWIYYKLAIWLLLGVVISVLKRKGTIGWPLFVLLLGLGVSSAYLGIFKP